MLPATLEIVSSDAVSSWLIQVVDATTRGGGATAISCAEIIERAPELDSAASQNVVDIPEPVLQELMLNLDASLGAAVELCIAGNEAGALEEWAAAVEIADVVADRLEQMR